MIDKRLHLLLISIMSWQAVYPGSFVGEVEVGYAVINVPDKNPLKFSMQNNSENDGAIYSVASYLKEVKDGLGLLIASITTDIASYNDTVGSVILSSNTKELQDNLSRDKKMFEDDQKAILSIRQKVKDQIEQTDMALDDWDRELKVIGKNNEEKIKAAVIKINDSLQKIKKEYDLLKSIKDEVQKVLKNFESTEILDTKKSDTVDVPATSSMVSIHIPDKKAFIADIKNQQELSDLQNLVKQYLTEVGEQQENLIFEIGNNMQEYIRKSQYLTLSTSAKFKYNSEQFKRNLSVQKKKLINDQDAAYHFANKIIGDIEQTRKILDKVNVDNVVLINSNLKEIYDNYNAIKKIKDNFVNTVALFDKNAAIDAKIQAKIGKLDPLKEIIETSKAVLDGQVKYWTGLNITLNKLPSVSEDVKVDVRNFFDLFSQAKISLDHLISLYRERSRMENDFIEDISNPNDIEKIDGRMDYLANSFFSEHNHFNDILTLIQKNREKISRLLQGLLMKKDDSLSIDLKAVDRVLELFHVVKLEKDRKAMIRDNRKRA
ncbi:hypothetical protein HYV10_02495 [Candidatus Dependentiae bacterium]|nr:hypothetical protein [Candidatus Dependentiae bacterium]